MLQRSSAVGGGHHARARRCQSEAPSRHTNHQRLPRVTAPSDYGRLADEDYRMGDGGGGNKENQLVSILPVATDPDTDKEKHFLRHHGQSVMT